MICSNAFAVVCGCSVTSSRGVAGFSLAGLPIWLSGFALCRDTPGYPYRVQVTLEMLVKSIAVYTLPAVPWLTPSFTWREWVGQGTAGSTYTTIDFTNISNVTCTLYGYPGVSLQTARPLHQIGKPAKENPLTPRQLVTLQPQPTANALLRIVDAGNYPASTCGPVTAHYLQVYPPNQTAPAYIRYTTQTCSKPVRTMTVDVVKPGSGSS